MKCIIVILLSCLTLVSYSQKIDSTEVREYIEEVGIKHPNIVFTQVMLETGWLKCTNCSLDKNNLFGFYWKNSYISNPHWKESIERYKIWQDKWYRGGDYYTFLDCIYETNTGRCVRFAECPTYVNKLKKIYDRIYK